eukprot:TRINITY_DN9632_c0_g1_i1.p1 TRINITY_DN9632_c0_g1~~TRINITY_DN9632_c0_g1_i1.p1  ORF type:complete len:148 (-),score=12.57 TRINITY_DN9632_c0_g1_i1:12-455(-)
MIAHAEEVSKFNLRIKELEDERDLQRTKIDVYNLASLYTYYFVDNWNVVAENVSEAKAELEDGEISQAAFDTKISTLNSKYDIDVVELQQVCKERHGFAHTDLRSAASQQTFIQKMNHYKFAEEYEHANIVKHIVSKLQKTKLKRKK